MDYLKMFLCLLIVGACPFVVESDAPENKVLAAPAKTSVSAAPGSQLKSFDVTCTAYDLSYESCEKYESDPAYGLTCTGIDLRNKNRSEAMVIAVDPKKIPLGSKVLLVFPDERHRKYNGIYTAGDIGGAINGNRIDVFIPEHGEALSFAVASAKAYLLNS